MELATVNQVLRTGNMGSLSCQVGSSNPLVRARYSDAAYSRISWTLPNPAIPLVAFRGARINRFSLAFTPGPLTARDYKKLHCRELGLQIKLSPIQSSYKEEAPGFAPDFQAERLAAMIDGLRDLLSFEPGYSMTGTIWAAIQDIPADLRGPLLRKHLQLRHIEKLWNCIGDERLQGLPSTAASQSGSGGPQRPGFLKSNGRVLEEGLYDGKAFGVPSFIGTFQKKLFVSRRLGSKRKTDMYGRVLTVASGLLGPFIPLYFAVKPSTVVPATEEYADCVLEYGRGQLHLRHEDLPPGWPAPAPHVYPFTQGLCDYLLLVGPGVIIGQSWNDTSTLGYGDQDPPSRFFAPYFLLVKSEL